MATHASRVEQLARILVDRDLKLATVESCTGGLIGAAFTDLAGSSDWYEGGWVTYSNELKVALGVTAALIDAEGAVSEAVASAMARAGQRSAGVELALAVTGVAGPGGGSVEKPVGTVWIAWAIGPDVDARCFRFDGDRAAVRAQSVEAALDGLMQRL